MYCGRELNYNATFPSDCCKSKDDHFQLDKHRAYIPELHPQLFHQKELALLTDLAQKSWLALDTTIGLCVFGFTPQKCTPYALTMCQTNDIVFFGLLTLKLKNKFNIQLIETASIKPAANKHQLNTLTHYTPTHHHSHCTLLFIISSLSFRLFCPFWTSPSASPPALCLFSRGRFSAAL